MIKKYLYVSFLLGFSLIISSCTHKGQRLISKGGIMHLENESNLAYVTKNLDGKLLFYWNQIPFDDNKFDLKQLKNAQEISIFPTTWKELGYPSKGYGTFRFQVHLPDIKEDLMLYIPRIESAGQVWINGVNTEEFGSFSMEEVNSDAYGKPLYISLNNKNQSKLDVIIVTSNYHHAKGGGFPYGLKIGPKDKIMRSASIAEYMEGGTILVILIISLYHIFILFFTDKKYMILYFGLLCSTACIRQFFVGEAIIYNFFPDIPYYIVQLGRYLPLYFGGTFFLVYYKNLIPDYSLIFLSRTIIAAFLLLAIFCLFVPTFESTYTSYVNSFIGLICLGTVLFGVTRAFIAKAYLSTPIFISTIMAILFLVNDLLLILKVTNTLFLTNYGIMFFLTLQASINYRFNKEANTKAKELFERVLRLEREVQIKTEEVSTLLTESIQQLKSKQELTHKLDVIRKSGDKSELSEIVAELKSEKLKDNRVIILKQNIENLNYSFISKLKEQFPELTRTDIEICSFIRLGLTSKEIANIRSTSVFSVKSSRYRIRKKLHLDKDTSLTSYLKSFEV